MSAAHFATSEFSPPGKPGRSNGIDPIAIMCAIRVNNSAASKNCDDFAGCSVAATVLFRIATLYRAIR